MAPSLPFVASAFIGLVAAQHVGENPEVHPKLITYECTLDGGCVEQNTAIVLDALSHPVYQVDAPSLGCGDWGNPPNETACPDIETCQKNCVMQGIEDYSAHGVRTDGSELHLDMLADDGSVLTPRVYLLREDEQEYQMLQLTGKEFTFDVDVSKLPCGMNGALYLSEMVADGSKSDLNQAGAFYGTGYCDAQCYTTPFIGGEPNLEGYGSCCNEMDIWEANARAAHLAPHPCNVPSLYECEGEECEYEGVCDKDGCSYNPYRLNNRESYGEGEEFTVDTSRPFTVITSFPADDEGKLVAYHRKYIQDGVLYDQGATNLTNFPEQDFLDDPLCEAQGARRYRELGATAGMGEALARGMVLAISVWWDEGGFMQWLDGGEAGPCNETEGDPENIRQIQPDTEVFFRNIKWGEIGSTYSAPSKCKKH